VISAGGRDAGALDGDSRRPKAAGFHAAVDQGAARHIAGQPPPIQQIQED
jgi:hypothetical protein